VPGKVKEAGGKDPLQPKCQVGGGGVNMRGAKKVIEGVKSKGGDLAVEWNQRQAGQLLPERWHGGQQGGKTTIYFGREIGVNSGSKKKKTKKEG